MKTVLRLGPLLLVPLLGLAVLNCGEEQSTEPEVQPVTIIVETAEANNDAVENPTLTATELLQDPALEAFLVALTVPNNAEKIRRAMDKAVADLESGNVAAAYTHFADARQAVADYRKGGGLDPEDDVHLDVTDFFLDGVEELLPEVDEGPPAGKKKS